MTTTEKTREQRTGKTYHDDLAIVREELDKCMKCGNCMSVCPVYGADKLETSVTRSKIAVAEAVLDGELGTGRSAGLRDAVQLPGLQVLHDQLPDQGQF